MGADRILVTGATGFLGRAVVAHLLARGHRTRAALRKPQDAGGTAETVVVGDLAGPVDWSTALRDVDCVIHTAGRAHQRDSVDPEEMAAFRCINVDATIALARQAHHSGVRRLIFISSAHVNGGSTSGRGFRSDDEPHPVGPYARSKADAEVGLAGLARDTGLEVVIIRPPLIIGAGVKGNLHTLYEAIRRGVPLPFANITRNRRDLVSCATLCDLVACCIDHPDAAGGTFMVSDGAPLSTRALVEQIADEIGMRPRLVPIPVPLLQGSLKAFGRSRMAGQLTGDLEIDITQTRERLGWHPPSRTLVLVGEST